MRTLWRGSLRIALAAVASLLLLWAGQAQQENKATGTGFVVDPNGYVLTCQHVVENAGKVSVTLGGTVYDAAVVAADEKHDLALLEIKAKGLPALPLANSNKVEVGEEVRAVGFPISSLLGADVKVTKGTVSGISTRDAAKVFQVDAPVNPGNSGGPLVNDRGDVVGVVNAELAGPAVSDIGFAVPINYAKMMLQVNGVEFVAGAAVAKLDGPTLAKRVSPSVALITVIPKGAPGETAPPQPAAPVAPPLPSGAEEMKKAQADGLAALAKKGVAPPARMVLVPAGEFETDQGEKVALNAFWVDKTEVTDAQFGRFVAETGYQPAGGWKPAAAGQGALPAVNVTWADSAAYAKWAGKRLPRESEWEKAARGTDRRAYPWGNEFDAARANGEGQADGFKGLAPVATFPEGASPWGALDMAGNAWEWTADWWEHGAAEPALRAADTGLSRSIRGGSFASGEKALRGSRRAALLPNLALGELGFRCVKDEPALPPARGPEPAAPAAAAWEGALKFKGEDAELKCTPKFHQVTFRTALGTLALRREYLLALGPNEAQLLGGSLLRGELQEKTLPVQWRLGERQIAVADIETYERAAPPLLVSVGVTKDGDIVSPQYAAQVMLADETSLRCDFREREVRLQGAGIGEVSIPVEKISVLVGEPEGVRVSLRDGNAVRGKLLGEYHLALLEGALSLTAAAPLRLATFAGAAGMVAGIERNWLKDGSVMVYVPAGEFTMGSPQGEGSNSEYPQHKVTLPGFWIDKYEVTNEQYGKFLEWMKKTNDHGKCAKGEPANKEHTPPGWTDASGNRAKHPVEVVDWWDACAYAGWVGKRLPTEAEWEKAARGTDGRAYPWGNEWDPRKCNISEGRAGRTTPVGTYPAGASPYGSLDMAGNVWEWTSSRYKPYPYRADDGGENTNDNSQRVGRGGGWRHTPVYARASSRISYDPAARLYSLGFRLARSYTK